MAEKEDFLIVDDIGIVFKDVPVLENISFTVKEGEGFGILGKSGCGKTVLMNIIRGIPEYEPTHGTITYRVAACQNPDCRWVEPPSKVGEKCARCGSEMKLEEVDYWKALKAESFDERRIAQNIYDRISLMIQRTFALFGESPVIQNIQEALRDAGIPKHEWMRRAMELLRRVHLTHRATHIARDISGGEKQRCVFAMCLAKQPMLFLADEPSGTLDPITAQAVHDCINQERARGLTFLVTSHWPDAVVETTDRAILLENGRMTKIGPSPEVRDAFMEGFEMPPIERRKLDKPIIKMINMRKYFYTFDRGLIKAVDDVTLEIYEGEIFGLVGVSGSGKTTAFKAIAGLIEPSRGVLQVRIGDEWVDMTALGPEGKGKATPYINILHQVYTVYPNLNVYDNMASALTIELPADIVAMKVYDCLKAVGFTEEEIDRILYMYPDALSEGERHRLAFARVLMTDPKIVLLDEPTGTADPLTRLEMVKSIKKARDTLGQTYIVVSHDIDFIEMVCDRAALMRVGKLVEVGDPTEVVKIMKEVETPLGV
ncbi:MAG TPA: methyl coenzyme M reductase system, component A2 [Candidatus Syntrophoarchaeum butanivorans]|uniref:Methyl coenzyme M reductase system, component A2 n=1 Tax=Candidatus Syntropharchaeum butanivorans TaxID=1839936 RepID=A0A7C1B6Q1_9EURY|nr:MAG: methyl coenzyme M reductase system, component A2 [Candidatus Syntrophoarchaeum sp. WYZ-LMO15]HDM36952.1 methyl coenzyme M reductase system, component A2 [Candidatus Syntrophoarchaeum butanivorans]